MKRPGKRQKRGVPQPGGEAFHEGEAAPLTHSVPMPPVKSHSRLLPVEASDSANMSELLAGSPARQPAEAAPPDPKRTLVVASEEVAKLPRGAREAFAARCAARVARLRENATSPEAAAALLLAAATVGTPIRKQLLCIRRDFDRLVKLASQHNWSEGTPVPPEVFGPMWPKNLTPDWAKESPASNTSEAPPPANPT